ncbi:uncharacterized protein LOC126995161 [Eriocheir sinensis]|uniref:uncharacterized protein LOC126995161 n=1 Tax=Eriocheir sinensis TaxID=95602 RepID=UPI0021C82C31|nr:uncharacterized protein LOC126995161 [Eriocheir sinensis]
MKFRLLFCALCLWGQAAGQGAEVLRIVQELSRDLQESANQRDSWLTRYQQIADVIKNSNDLSEELLEISNVAMPVIWNTFMAVTMGISLQQIGKGAVGSPYIPSPFPLPPPQPEYLFIFPSNLTCDDKFTVQMTVIPTAEANVGFRLHFAPPDGEPLDFENGDLFFSFHLRWHFDYGPSKEIAFNDRYNGEWSAQR